MYSSLCVSSTCGPPRLLKFTGRPRDFTPKARIRQLMGWGRHLCTSAEFVCLLTPSNSFIFQLHPPLWPPRLDNRPVRKNRHLRHWFLQWGSGQGGRCVLFLGRTTRSNFRRGDGSCEEVVADGEWVMVNPENIIYWFMSTSLIIVWGHGAKVDNSPPIPSRTQPQVQLTFFKSNLVSERHTTHFLKPIYRCRGAKKKDRLLD